MASGGTTALSFCTECGSRLVEKRCPAGHAPRLSDPPGRATRRNPWLRGATALSIGTALIAITSLVTTLLVSTSLRQRLSDTQAELASVAGDLKQISRQVSAQQEAGQALAAQIGGLESVQNAAPDLEKVAKQAQRSVFTVEVTSGSGSIVGQGSAFVFRTGGQGSTLLTNFHVVEESVDRGYPLQIRTGDASYSATVVNVSRTRDLATLQIDEGFPRLRPARGSLSVGETVLVIGSPLGLEGTIATGLYSGRTDGLIQFSAPVSPGSSGGPVLNEAGEVVGVTVSKAAGVGVEGLSFAVPISDVCVTVLNC